MKLCKLGKCREEVLTLDKDAHVGLSDDITAFGSNHHSRSCGGVLDGFEETTRNASGPLYAGLVVELSVVVCGAVLDPVACE